MDLRHVHPAARETDQEKRERPDPLPVGDRAQESTPLGYSSTNGYQSARKRGESRPRDARVARRDDGPRDPHLRSTEVLRFGYGGTKTP